MLTYPAAGTGLGQEQEQSLRCRSHAFLCTFGLTLQNELLMHHLMTWHESSEPPCISLHFCILERPPFISVSLELARYLLQMVTRYKAPSREGSGPGRQVRV